MHELIDRFAGERVAGEFDTEQVVAIEAHATGGGRSAGWAGEWQESQFAARVELRGGGCRRVNHERRRDDVRIAAQVAIGKWVVKADVAVVGTEPVAPIVA